MMEKLYTDLSLKTIIFNNCLINFFCIDSDGCKVNESHCYWALERYFYNVIA